MNFKITDGLAPADKVLNVESNQVAMQVIGSSPQLGAGYNIAPMFSYLMKIQGADLTPFEKSPQQLAYESAVSQWQQAAMLAAQKGAAFSTPQPLPQQFGYDPATQGGASPAGVPAPQVATRVNNITNNITNTGEGA